MTSPCRASLLRRLSLLVVAAVALGSGGCAFFGEGINIELNQEQLQRIVDAVFPLDNAEEASNVTVTLSQPAVTPPTTPPCAVLVSYTESYATFRTVRKMVSWDVWDHSATLGIAVPVFGSISDSRRHIFLGLGTPHPSWNRI